MGSDVDLSQRNGSRINSTGTSCLCPASITVPGTEVVLTQCVSQLGHTGGQEHTSKVCGTGVINAQCVEAKKIRLDYLQQAGPDTHNKYTNHAEVKKLF